MCDVCSAHYCYHCENIKQDEVRKLQANGSYTCRTCTATLKDTDQIPDSVNPLVTTKYANLQPGANCSALIVAISHPLPLLQPPLPANQLPRLANTKVTTQRGNTWANPGKNSQS